MELPVVARPAVIAAARLTESCPRRTGWSQRLDFDCARKACNLYSRRRAGKVFPHEIDIQETDPKQSKLDSQAALPHPTRDRPADGLRPKAWPLWASRRDHDPCRLSPRSAGLGGLRPAMATGRAIRGPPARPPGQERDFQRTSDPR